MATMAAHVPKLNSVLSSLKPEQMAVVLVRGGAFAAKVSRLGSLMGAFIAAFPFLVMALIRLLDITAL